MVHKLHTRKDRITMAMTYIKTEGDKAYFTDEAEEWLIRCKKCDELMIDARCRYRHVFPGKRESPWNSGFCEECVLKFTKECDICHNIYRYPGEFAICFWTNLNHDDAYDYVCDDCFDKRPKEVLALALRHDTINLIHI